MAPTSSRPRRPAGIALAAVALAALVVFVAGRWRDRVATGARGPSPTVAAANVTPSSRGQRVTPGPDTRSALELWEAVPAENSAAAFREWARTYIISDDAAKAAAAEEGVRLATERRAMLAQLIRLAPDEALRSAVPESVRAQLPRAVTRLLETRVDARGDLEVTARSPGDEPAAGPAVTRVATIGGQQYQAHVYGSREAQPSRWNLPLHGIALDGRLALSELPGRVLEPAEAAVVKTAAADPVCTVSGLPSASLGARTVVLSGTDFHFFCGREHASALLGSLQQQEALLPPAFNAPFKTAANAASGGNGVSAPNFLPDGDPKWTRGVKRAVVVRLRFKGDDLHQMSYEDCAEMVNRIDERWSQWSYGRCRLQAVGSGSHVTAMLDLDQYDFEYTEDDIGDIWDAAEDWADDQGYSTDSYEHLIVIAGKAGFRQVDTGEDYPPPVTWGGIGRVGGRYTLMRVTDTTEEARIERNTRVSMHELGHNLGLAHASSLFTTPIPLATVGNVTIYKTGEEYGDPFDTMGHGIQDYNVRYKNWLHWLDDGDVPVALTEGHYIIHEHDLGERGGGARGLQVPFAPALMLFDSLFVEYRLNDASKPLYVSGPTIRLGLSTGPKAYYLDGRPETPNDGSLKNDFGNVDAQLPPGRTFSYERFGLTVHVTTLSADPDSGEVELMVKYGTPPGNNAPTGNILPWSGAATGQTVYFTADASDADGDDLAFAWEATEFAEVIPADPTIGVTWNTPGSKTVTCRVSDMHGGVTTLHYTVNVVVNQPPTLTLAATAATDEDTPVSINFTVSDPTLDPSAITTTVLSSNQPVVPKAGVVITPLGGGGRKLTVTPAPNQHGLVPVFVTASDGQLKVTKRIDVTVRPTTPGTTLLAQGAAWSYWDAATAPGHNWTALGFREQGWKRDTARFVYNQGLLTPASWTVLSNVPGRVTTYYRTTFTAPATLTGSLTLKLLCDDGAVVYLNGDEVWRQNMPHGTVTPTTRASRSIEGKEEGLFVIVPLPNAAINAGALNTIAVEVHDAGGLLGGRGGGDVSFDASLAMLDAPKVGRMPNQTMPEDTVLGPVAFSASDSESPQGALAITGTSSNPSVIPDGGISVSYNLLLGWRFKIVPVVNASGTADITLDVSDGSSLTRRTFTVTVTPVNDPPVVDPIPSMATALGKIPKLVRVRVTDVDNDPATLQVQAKSANPAVVKDAGIEVLPGSTPDERWLRITPVPGVFADATITVTASDGSLGGSTSFLFRVSEQVPASSVNIPLVESGATWRYWADTLPLDPRGGPVDWTSPALSDRAWPFGTTPLGYEGTAKSTVPSLPLRVTTYFRRSFSIPDRSVLSKLHIRLLRDDGAVVYLNGTRIYTSNMPRGTPAASTLASTDISGLAEQIWVESDLDLAAAVNGRNQLAVEIHQSSVPTALARGDLTFDLELQGIPAATGDEDALVPQGDAWSYWDDGQYPGDAWRDGIFPATGWPEGLARFGFGVGGITTVLADGSPGFRRPSVLLRHLFDVAEPSFYSTLHLISQRDDGIVVYINGVRVLNDNMSTAATYSDWALGGVEAAERTKWRHHLLDPKLLVRGRNLIAVEVHQAYSDGTDMNFDAQLSGTVGPAAPPLFIRGTPDGHELSWPAAFEHWTVQGATSLSAADWGPLSPTKSSIDGWIHAVVPPAAVDGERFYRLMGP